ncbi:MAG: hypothetical protein GY725_10965 [bacterium]|nr:hypothetical protein [bacterium]
MSVFRFDSSEYYLEFSEEGAVEDRMAAHISVIAGQKFLNVRDIEDPNGLYNFARYTVSADGDLSFQFIKDDLFPDGQTSAKAVRKLVEDDPRYPGLFDPNAIRLRRVR